MLLLHQAKRNCIHIVAFISLQNRLVVLITNVKPGKLRDVMSEGLVIFLVDMDLHFCSVL